MCQAGTDDATLNLRVLATTAHRTNALFQRQKAAVDVSSLSCSLGVTVHRVSGTLATGQIDKVDLTTHVFAIPLRSRVVRRVQRYGNDRV